MKSFIHSSDHPPISCQAALSLLHLRAPLTSDGWSVGSRRENLSGIISNESLAARNKCIKCTKNGIMGIICLILLCSISFNNFWSHAPLSDWECIPVSKQSDDLQPSHMMITKCVMIHEKKISCPVISLRQAPRNGIVRSKDCNFKASFTSFTKFTNSANMQWSHVMFRTLCWALGLQRSPVVLDKATVSPHPCQ